MTDDPRKMVDTAVARDIAFIGLVCIGVVVAFGATMVVIVLKATGTW